jgi:hypothetical protein
MRTTVALALCLAACGSAQQDESATFGLTADFPLPAGCRENANIRAIEHPKIRQTHADGKLHFVAATAITAAERLSLTTRIASGMQRLLARRGLFLKRAMDTARRRRSAAQHGSDESFCNARREPDCQRREQRSRVQSTRADPRECARRVCSPSLVYVLPSPPYRVQPVRESVAGQRLHTRSATSASPAFFNRGHTDNNHGKPSSGRRWWVAVLGDPPQTVALIRKDKGLARRIPDERLTATLQVRDGPRQLHG